MTYWQPAPDGTLHLPRPGGERGHACDPGAQRGASVRRYTEAEAKALGLRVCARCKTIAALWPNER